MNHYATQPPPESMGELRHRLATLGNPWTADPDLADEEPLPDPPRGGRLEDVLHKRVRITKAQEGTGLVGEEPPANPYLRARWAEHGLLDETDVDPLRNAGGERT